jgi:hypothetical protein
MKLTEKHYEETFKQIKQNYEALRVGQSLHVTHLRANSDRVVGVGRKYIRTMYGAKLTGRDVIDWWKG